jgi:hypothetical protein
LHFVGLICFPCSICQERCKWAIGPFWAHD